MSEVTRILNAMQSGQTQAAADLLPLVYEELRRLAAARLALESSGHTLQPTALVHEAWLRLAGTSQPPHFANHAHFFAAAAEAMRRILIDSARRKEAKKRGASLKQVNLEDLDLAAKADDTALLRIDDALEKLAMEDPPSADLVKLRFFGGLTNDEAAAVLGISARTAKRYWTFARAWLYDEMRPDQARPPAPI